MIAVPKLSIIETSTFSSLTTSQPGSHSERRERHGENSK